MLRPIQTNWKSQFYGNSEEDVRDVIDSVIRSLNIDYLLEEMKKKCKIGDISSLWIKAVLNYRKNTILRGLESVKINEDEAQMPSVSFSKRK